MTIRPILLLASIFVFACTSTTAAEPVAQSESAAAIEYLLDSVAASDLQFMRNGKAHTGAKAAEHMRRKYEHFNDRIQSADDFIDLAATKSTISGKQYTVRTTDGEMATADWLHSILTDYRNTRNIDHSKST
ncbi:MAG: DUF5329 family protein [Proteobacteria bacterium]|nr:DUF5329 family protein [Pseudomonadota bacterium]